MNKILACLLVVLSSSVLSAALPEMTVADHGKSDYKIVYAETGTAEVNAFIKDSAKTLQEIVKFASGAELPVLPESAFKADSPAIFVGRVSALKKNPEEKRWASHILADGRNIFLWGDDRRCGPPDLKRNDAFRSFILGTRHAVLLFAQKFAGAVFLVMPDLKYSVPASGRIAVPGNFRHDRIPQIEYCIARGKGMNYDLGNNFRSAPGIARSADIRTTRPSRGRNTGRPIRNISGNPRLTNRHTAINRVRSTAFPIPRSGN